MPDFKHILDALMQEGFYQVTDTSEKTGKEFDYKVTPYSLNTKLSFKFDNMAHFLDFLRESGAIVDDEVKTVVQTAMQESDLKPGEFFYVNFFEKGKDTEM